MLGWIRALKRRRLRRRLFPENWLAILDRRVPFFRELEQPHRQRFLNDLKVFVWSKHFEGAGGMEITDEVRVVVAASAVRLTLNLDLSYYDRLTEIVVYPHIYRHPDDDSAIFGEAHSFGTVVLTRPTVLRGLANPEDGHDTATHEFAHVLDQGDGEFDGTPVLRRYAQYQPWTEVMSDHYLRLRQNRRRLRKVLRDYGATNEAEFFAVATESYFEKPEQMREQTPELYRELQRFYGGEPAAGKQS